MAAAKSSRPAEALTRGRGTHGGYTLAHFSDPHLSSPARASMGELLNKRFFGYLSWLSRRRAEHRREVLDALLRDLAQLRPHHTVITGDLTHLGLPSEFEQARQWLQTVGEPQDVTVVPGNHEAYVHTAPEETLGLWQPYLSSDEANDAATVRSGGRLQFPSLRIRGPLALIGLSSARPSGLFLATGRVGWAQRDALSQMLDATGRRKLVRVLLMHHPPLANTVGWRKRLVDSRSLRAILSRHGVELVLHGHGHRAAQGTLQTATGTAPVLGVPSASTVSVMAGRRAQYYVYRFADEGDTRLLTVSVRGYAHDRNGFAAEGERTLILPAAN